jgi:hypothetical protein
MGRCILWNSKLDVQDTAVDHLGLCDASLRSVKGVQCDIAEAAGAPGLLPHRDAIEHTAVLREMVLHCLRGGVSGNAPNE